MSDVQSNVKPLTLTTGRVIFAIAGVYVTQVWYRRCLCSPYPRWCALLGGALRACRCDNPVYAALGAEVYLGAVDRALAASAR